MISRVVLLATVVAFVIAEDIIENAHQNGSGDTELHLSKGYYVTKAIDADGKKHADGSLYLQGHFVKPGFSIGGGWPTAGGWSAPPSPPPQPPPPTAPPPTVGWGVSGGWSAPVMSTNYAIWTPSFDLWNAASYCVGVVAVVVSIWYTCSVIGAMGGFGKFGKPVVSTKKKTDAADDDEDEAVDADLKKVEKAKSRRRRGVEADAELNRLATIVLSAIESGECLQKTICLFGSQIGERKGRVASALLDKMVPLTVQSNTYFMTLKKSLKGEVYCEKFRCKH